MLTPDYYWFTIFVAINSMLLLALAMNISRLRIVKKIPHGDGDNIIMKQAIRAHGNGIEHVALYGLLLLALTFVNIGNLWMSVLVIVFTATRIAHAYGMIFKNFNARRAGALLTYILQGIVIIMLLTNIKA